MNKIKINMKKIYMATTFGLKKVNMNFLGKIMTKVPSEARVPSEALSPVSDVCTSQM